MVYFQVLLAFSGGQSSSVLLSVVKEVRCVLGDGRERNMLTSPGPEQEHSQEAALCTHCPGH